MDSIGYLWIQSVDGDADDGDSQDAQDADDGGDAQSANEEG